MIRRTILPLVIARFGGASEPFCRLCVGRLQVASMRGLLCKDPDGTTVRFESARALVDHIWMKTRGKPSERRVLKAAREHSTLEGFELSLVTADSVLEATEADDVIDIDVSTDAPGPVPAGYFCVTDLLRLASEFAVRHLCFQDTSKVKREDGMCREKSLDLFAV